MYKIFIIFFSICFINANSQQKNIIDSLILLSQSEASHDTVKIQAFTELSWEFRKTNFSKAKYYALNAYTISKKINYPKGIVTSLNRLGTAYIFNKQFSRAEKEYLKVLRLEKQSGNKYGIGRANNQLSEIYRNKKDLSKALSYGLDALNVFEQLKQQSLEALVSNNVGLIYQNMGSYEQANKYLLKGLAIREQLKEDKNIANSYTNLGILYLVMKNYESAKDYFLKSEYYFIKFNDDYELSKIYNNLGIIYFETGNNTLSQEYYDKAMKLKVKLGLKDTNSEIHNNLGALYYKQGDDKQATQEFKRSIDIQKKYVSKNRLKEANINLGHIYFRNQEYDQAIKYYKNSLKTSENSKNKSEKLKSLDGLYVAYSVKQDYDSAIYYSQQYNSLRDSLETDYKKTVDYREKFARIQKENELLQRDKKISIVNIKNLELKNQNNNILIYTLSTIFSLFVLLFFLWTKWKVERQKKEIALKDKELEEKKLEQLIKNQEIKSYNEMLNTQDRERKRISQDLHDRIGSILSVAKVYYKSGEEQLLQNKNLDLVSFQKANELIDEACQEVRRLSYEMSSGVLTKFGLLSAVEDLVITIEQTKKIKIEFIAGDLENRLENNIEIQIYRIIQELMNNILKYADSSHVTIQILKLKNKVNVQVEDDGIGFNTNEQSNGIGLQNIRSRVSSLGGEIEIDSVIGRGTYVNIEIPINSNI
ncbi:signal transduction histidine kinase/Tfp pilus assembly protein PilF [Epilithonimonas hungarica]|uniref:ATP-binding protein n=1 Tax=Epilithonimonas hungarica TaxID=454006 RepID=UPI0027808E4F|nr:tetratricopeptide repeat protein [Epilithonimonas hungarica]MDP9954980.1 signal transduction histidine kinase/Tfp pilus assembly protein PilF [Epilithonimonas hungarica]